MTEGLQNAVGTALGKVARSWVTAGIAPVPAGADSASMQTWLVEALAAMPHTEAQRALYLAVETLQDTLPRGLAVEITRDIAQQAGVDRALLWQAGLEGGQE